MAEIIDGKAVAHSVRLEVRDRVTEFSARFHRAPGLATVLVGADPASVTYVRNKRKACAECGIESIACELPETTTQAQLIDLVRELNARSDAHGILVQLPLPPTIDAPSVLREIDPDKDVDGLHPMNQAKLVLGEEGLRPCTPLGVMRLLDTTGVESRGARAVIVGRSALVGKPVAFLLLERHATVTICHSRTRNLAEEVSRADILVAAIGREKHIKGEWIRPGSVVLDVGINRNAEGKLVGDVDFASARDRAGFITPVPGGVGPMTIAMLMANTVTAATRQELRRSGRAS